MAIPVHGLNQIMRQPFACETDAYKALEQWLECQEFIRIDDATVMRHDKRTKRGRPGVNDEVVTTFQITGTILTDLSLCIEMGVFLFTRNQCPTH